MARSVRDWVQSPDKISAIPPLRVRARARARDPVIKYGEARVYAPGVYIYTIYYLIPSTRFAASRLAGSRARHG